MADEWTGLSKYRRRIAMGEWLAERGWERVGGVKGDWKHPGRTGLFSVAAAVRVEKSGATPTGVPETDEEAYARVRAAWDALPPVTAPTGPNPWEDDGE